MPFPDFETLATAAVAILKQCPGIERDRFLRRLGFQPCRYRRDRSKNLQTVVTLRDDAKRALTELEREGVIRLQPPSPIRASPTVFPTDYVPPRPAVAKPMAAATTTIDPFLVGAWQPKEKLRRSPADDIPTATRWRSAKPSTPTEHPDMTRTRENLERVLAAIALAEQAAIENGSFKLPTRNAIGTSLGLDDYFYAGTQGGKQATVAYNAAQTRLTLLRAERESAVSEDAPPTPQPPPLSPQPFIPPLPTSDPYTQRLEAEIARLQAEKDALQAQLQQQPVSSDPSLVLEALKTEETTLLLDARELGDRITEIEQTRAQLLGNAELLRRLIERMEQRETVAVAVVAPTNGHRQMVGVTR